jgi:hypothetical protein
MKHGHFSRAPTNCGKMQQSPEIAQQKRKLPQGRGSATRDGAHSNPKKHLPVKESICSGLSHRCVNVGLGLTKSLLLWLERSTRTEDNSTCSWLRCWTRWWRVDSSEVGSRGEEAGILLLITPGSVVGSATAWSGSSAEGTGETLDSAVVEQWFIGYGIVVACQLS